MIIVTIGGWDTLEGAKPLQIAYIVIYLVMAFLVMRWNRGVLPLAAALAIMLLIFAAVSAPAGSTATRPASPTRRSTRTSSACSPSSSCRSRSS